MGKQGKNLPLQDELLTWTSQFRTGQPSIFAIRVWHILYHMYYRTDQHSSSPCKCTFELLHLGSHTTIFAVLKARLIIMSPLITLCYKLIRFLHWLAIYHGLKLTVFSMYWPISSLQWLWAWPHSTNSSPARAEIFRPGPTRPGEI